MEGGTTLDCLGGPSVQCIGGCLRTKHKNCAYGVNACSVPNVHTRVGVLRGAENDGAVIRLHIRP